VSGDLAYMVNSYFYTCHPADGSPRWHKSENVHVRRRDRAGAWKLEVDIWDSDVPIAALGDEQPGLGRRNGEE
jgi:ketosteroid isomerase-like protein